MNCRSTGELITRYVSGDLSGAVKDELEEHIRGCPGCRAELSVARSLEELLRGQPLVPAPAGLGDRIMQSIDSSGESFITTVGERIIELRRKYLRRQKILSVAALTAGVIILSLVRGEWIGQLTGVASNVTGEEIFEAGLSLFGTVDGGFNITYLNPVLAVLSLLYGVVSISRYLNPRITGRVLSYLRLW